MSHSTSGDTYVASSMENVNLLHIIVKYNFSVLFDTVTSFVISLDKNHGLGLSSILQTIYAGDGQAYKWVED